MAEGDQAHLSLLIILQSEWIELFENFFGRFVSVDLAVCIKGNHIGCIDGCRELEELFKTLFLRTSDILFCHCDHESVRWWLCDTRGSPVITIDIEPGGVTRIESHLDESLADLGLLLVGLILVATNNPVFELLLVVVRPLLDRQFGNLDSLAVNNLGGTRAEVLSLVVHLFNLALEATVPRSHWNHRFALHLTANILNNIDRVEVWDRGTPTYG
jgi:hypothetical protein